MTALRGAGLGVFGCALAIAAGMAAREISVASGLGLSKPAAVAPETPRPGGTLRLFSEAPASLDPRDVHSVYESLPVNQIFDGLVRLDPSLNVMPSLAQSWTISRDGLRYTFRLRDGVKFHDGASLTAADVIFSIGRALAPIDGERASAATYLGAMEGATEFAAGRTRELPGLRALDERTVEMRLTRPSPSFLEVLALDALRIVPRGAVAALGEAAFRRAPVGTGPFRFDSRTEERVVLRANREHFRKGPHLDEVQLVFPEDGEVDGGLARFRRGELDAFEPWPDALAELAGADGVAVDRFQELNVYFLGLATFHPNFDSPLVRRAVAHAIDRSAMVAIAPDTLRVAHGILPPSLPDYSPGAKTLPHDPAKARALLAESGHPGGAGLRPFNIYVPAGSLGEQRTFERLAADLRAVGFRCEVKSVGWGDLSRRVDDNAATAFVIGWIADLADPDAFLRGLFAPEASENYFGFRDPETERLLEEVGVATDPVDRRRLHAAIEQTIVEQAPFVPLFHSVGLLARRAGVHGLEPGPLGLAALDLETVWIGKER